MTKQDNEIFLHPGDWYFGDKHHKVRTLLGSCVSITLWHPKAKLGGMCHYLLARRTDRRSAALSGRYGDEAMLLMLHEVLASGRCCRNSRPSWWAAPRCWPAWSATSRMMCRRATSTWPTNWSSNSGYRCRRRIWAATARGW